MAVKTVLKSIQSSYSSLASLNSNFERIAAAFDNTVSRDGTGPNQMLSNLNMNNFKIQNLPTPSNPTDAARLIDIAVGLDSQLIGTNGSVIDSLGFSTLAAPSQNAVSNGLNLKTTASVLLASAGSTLVGWISSLTGSVYRTIQGKLSDHVSVKDFGAVGNGTADDTVAIQKAFTTGGHVYFPAGSYRVSSTLSITSQIMVTAGCGSAVLVSTFPTGNVVEITGPTPESGAAKITIDGLEFDTAVTRTSGAYIQVSNGVYNVDIVRCRFTRGFTHVRNTGIGGFGFYVRNCIHYYAANGSVLIDNTSPAVEQLLENLNIIGPSTETNSAFGVKVVCAGDIVLNHVSTVKAGKGLWVAPTTGVRVQLMMVTNCFFDSGIDWGIYCRTEGGNIDCLKISNVWSATSSLGGGGYFGTAGAGVIRHVDLVNSEFSNNQLQGIRVSSNVTNMKIIGCSGGSNRQHGCLIDADTQKFTITACTFGPTGEMNGNTLNGILIETGNSDNYIVSLNHTSGNGSMNIIDNGAGANKYVVNNI